MSCFRDNIGRKVIFVMDVCMGRWGVGDMNLKRDASVPLPQ